jgi:hypothetical protein
MTASQTHLTRGAFDEERDGQDASMGGSPAANVSVRSAWAPTRKLSSLFIHRQ